MLVYLPTFTVLFFPTITELNINNFNLVLMAPCFLVVRLRGPYRYLENPTCGHIYLASKVKSTKIKKYMNITVPSVRPVQQEEILIVQAIQSRQ